MIPKGAPPSESGWTAEANLPCRWKYTEFCDTLNQDILSGTVSAPDLGAGVTLASDPETVHGEDKRNPPVLCSPLVKMEQAERQRQRRDEALRFSFTTAPHDMVEEFAALRSRQWDHGVPDQGSHMSMAKTVAQSTRRYNACFGSAAPRFAQAPAGAETPGSIYAKPRGDPDSISTKHPEQSSATFTNAERPSLTATLGVSGNPEDSGPSFKYAPDRTLPDSMQVNQPDRPSEGFRRAGHQPLHSKGGGFSADGGGDIFKFVADRTLPDSIRVAQPGVASSGFHCEGRDGARAQGGGQPAAADRDIDAGATSSDHLPARGLPDSVRVKQPQVPSAAFKAPERPKKFAGVPEDQSDTSLFYEKTPDRTLPASVRVREPSRQQPAFAAGGARLRTPPSLGGAELQFVPDRTLPDSVSTFQTEVPSAAFRARGHRSLFAEPADGGGPSFSHQPDRGAPDSLAVKAPKQQSMAFRAAPRGELYAAGKAGEGGPSFSNQPDRGLPETVRVRDPARQTAQFLSPPRKPLMTEAPDGPVFSYVVDHTKPASIMVKMPLRQHPAFHARTAGHSELSDGACGVKVTDTGKVVTDRPSFNGYVPARTEPDSVRTKEPAKASAAFRGTTRAQRMKLGRDAAGPPADAPASAPKGGAGAGGAAAPRQHAPRSGKKVVAYTPIKTRSDPDSVKVHSPERESATMRTVPRKPLYAVEGGGSPRTTVFAKFFSNGAAVSNAE
jgi:hypothetical protein